VVRAWRGGLPLFTNYCREKLSGKSKLALWESLRSVQNCAEQPYMAFFMAPQITFVEPSSYLSGSFRRRLLGNLGGVQENVGEHYTQLSRSFCVLIRLGVYGQHRAESV
jgi:hypothetical protein